MKTIPVVLIIFWVIIIMFPDIIAYLIWWFMIFVWINIFAFSKMVKKGNEDYVKFGNYKIFR